MLSATDHALLTSAMAIALIVVKAIEKTIDWASKRLGGEKGGKTEVSLSAEPSRMLRETHERVGDMDKVLARVDGDGVPMVYTPRSALTNQLKMAEALRDISIRNESFQDETSRKIEEILSAVKKAQ